MFSTNGNENVAEPRCESRLESGVVARRSVEMVPETNAYGHCITNGYSTDSLEISSPNEWVVERRTVKVRSEIIRVKSNFRRSSLKFWLTFGDVRRDSLIGSCSGEPSGDPRLPSDTWLILPVVICLSQRLSHACLSSYLYTVKLRMAH